VPKHRHGHAHVLPTHAEHGGAHLPAEGSGPDRAGRLLPLLAVGLAVALVIGVAAAVGTRGGGDSGAAKPDGGGAVSASLATSETRTLRQCRASWQALRHALVAAEPSMGQWERHVRVMNRLVAGEITLAQASRFWAQTRVAARQRYDAFAAQDRRMRRSGAGHGCAARTTQAADSTGPALTACRRAAAAEQATLATARTALARWRGHISAMEQLRSGTLSPTMAQQMWQTTWHRGAAELRAYHRREQQSSALSCRP